MEINMNTLIGSRTMVHSQLYITKKELELCRFTAANDKLHTISSYS